MNDKKPSVTPTLSTRSDSVIESPALSVQKGNSIVKASNVLMRNQYLFLTAEESRPKVEKFEVEIILQKSQISLKKKGKNGAESEIVNDVFTILEHPSKSVQKLSESERLMKKETLYEVHVRAGLVKVITANFIDEQKLFLTAEVSFFMSLSLSLSICTLFEGCSKIMNTSFTISDSALLITFFRVILDFCNIISSSNFSTCGRLSSAVRKSFWFLTSAFIAIYFARRTQ